MALTSDTVISLKQDDQYVTCVDGSNCRLEESFSDSAKLIFRKGYDIANGNAGGDPADTSAIEVGQPFVIVLRKASTSPNIYSL